MADSIQLKNSRLRLESKTRDCGIKTYNLQWTIHGYRDLHRDQTYSGPHLQIGDVVCRLKLYMTKDAQREFVYLALNGPTSVRATFTLHCPDGDTQFGDANLLDFAPSLADSGLFFAFEVDRSTADLVVFCAVETNLLVFGDICEAVRVEERSTLSDDLERLLGNEMYSDVDLKVDGRTFKAHRAILYARSAYFADMFSRGNRRELAFDGLDSETFQEVLNYMYTQNTKLYTLEMTMQLLSASVTFELENLRVFLADHLVGTMSLEFAFYLVVHAHTNQLADLKNYAIECIGNNLDVALDHEDWPKFSNHKVLVDQLFRYVAKRLVW